MVLLVTRTPGTMVAVALSFNSAPHCSTAYPPYFHVHGRQPHVHASLFTPAVSYSPQNYDSVHSHGEEQRIKREYFNKHVRFKSYQCGDLVWVDDPTTQRKKLDSKWTAPYR